MPTNNFTVVLLLLVIATCASAKDSLKSHFKPIFEEFGEHSLSLIHI